MQSLVNQAAQDIKDCGNTCDTWMKKKVLMKVFVGPAWEGKLAAFSSAFNMRRMQFEFALQIHTATAVDQIKAVTEAMNEKYAIHYSSISVAHIASRLSRLTEHFLQAYSQLRPTDEVQLAERIALKGDIQTIRSNETVLRELFKTESAKTATSEGDGPIHRPTGARPSQQSEYTFSDFKDELREGWDTAMRNNLEAFTAKYQLFYDRLESNLRKYMREESDLVITTLSKGPHDLIRNPVSSIHLTFSATG